MIKKKKRRRVGSGDLIEPTGTEDLAQDSLLFGQIDVVRRFTVPVGSVQQLTVFRITQQHLDDGL